MTRQSGYYWVKHTEECIFEVGFFFDYDGVWQLMGACNVRVLEFDLYQINETRILAPDEVSDE